MSNPAAVMLENVRGLLDPRFEDYRNSVLAVLSKLGYQAEWKLLQASDFGVPQLRPRSILVGLKHGIAHHFSWPVAGLVKAPLVGDVLFDMMAADGWKGAKDWRAGEKIRAAINAAAAKNVSKRTRVMVAETV